jgi:hypothetical protein
MFKKIKNLILAVLSTVLLGGIVFASMLMGYILTIIGVVLLAVVFTLFIFVGLNVDYKSYKKSKTNKEHNP